MKPSLGVFLLVAVLALHPSNPVTEAIRSIAMVEIVDGHCTAFSPSVRLWVTKWHCAEDGYKFKIMGEDAEFVKEDKDLDLLLLSGPIVAPLKIANEEVELGDQMVLFGWPLGWADSVPYISYGHMSALGVFRTYTPQVKRARLNAVDGTTYFGMSGGPVLNRNGEVVGVIDGMATNPPIPIAYITPLKELRKFLGMK